MQQGALERRSERRAKDIVATHQFRLPKHIPVHEVHYLYLIRSKCGCFTMQDAYLSVTVGSATTEPGSSSCASSETMTFL